MQKLHTLSNNTDWNAQQLCQTAGKKANGCGRLFERHKLNLSENRCAVQFFGSWKIEYHVCVNPPYIFSCEIYFPSWYFAKSFAHKVLNFHTEYSQESIERRSVSVIFAQLQRR